AVSRLSSRRTTEELSSVIDAARSFCRGGAGARAIWTSGSQVASVSSNGRSRRSAARRHCRAARDSREPKAAPPALFGGTMPYYIDDVPIGGKSSIFKAGGPATGPPPRLRNRFGPPDLVVAAVPWPRVHERVDAGVAMIDVEDTLAPEIVEGEPVAVLH